MSKNRRDSSVCELEQRIRDVKQTNCRFRKVLMEKEAELQALIKRLGPDARAWIGLETSTSEPDVNKESVKIQVKKDYASEGTEFTSIGSLVSSNDTLDSVGPERKKKTTVVLPGEEPPVKPIATITNSVPKSNLVNVSAGTGAIHTTTATAIAITATNTVTTAAQTVMTTATQPTVPKVSATSNSITSCTSVPQDPSYKNVQNKHFMRN